MSISETVDAFFFVVMVEVAPLVVVVVDAVPLEFLVVAAAADDECDGCGSDLEDADAFAVLLVLLPPPRRVDGGGLPRGGGGLWEGEVRRLRWPRGGVRVRVLASSLLSLSGDRDLDRWRSCRRAGSSVVGSC